MKFSLVDTFSDECGMLDFSRSQNGSGISCRNKVKYFFVLMMDVIIMNCDIISR